MAEPLKNQFGEDVPRKIARMILEPFPEFDADGFIRESLEGYEPLSLTQRGWQIAHALRRYLPDEYPRAIEILLASLGPKLDGTEGMGMAPFLYLPHIFFIAEYGLDFFEETMQAQYELTQRFTAEFSIRPYIKKYPQRTLEILQDWTRDPSVHVRRLISEGTRPRLPWAPRLQMFIDDPRPVIALLELLKDDPELYVRRSVANNLNDIGKDHPELLAEIARRWSDGASIERQWLIRHALRSAIKRGDPGALAVMGYGYCAHVDIEKVKIVPMKPVIGDILVIALDVVNNSLLRQRVLVDLQIHYIKANGKSSPKVFKLKSLDLAVGECRGLQKTISLADMTTRKHYPGTHYLDVILNGETRKIGSFELRPAR